ncbi:hypothetical protein JCM9157_1427 [Halalkalibacter akibai JCM 9157]|uniref:Uncharacterized protein n=1 Tax=Halalkalibacter akibai (strain ATCC 43226 / DSM 21942 / CIP 109018 / JCM 9157 / 1139) TaxID=1236973 RepID=W4QQJ2_HALA3|nr:hypothetical protein JCM9157_1427 [Halalkalibacter akibai JCM 9157]
MVILQGSGDDGNASQSYVPLLKHVATVFYNEAIVIAKKTWQERSHLPAHPKNDLNIYLVHHQTLKEFAFFRCCSVDE